MANVGLDCSLAGQQTTVVNESCFSWIMRLFGLKYGRCPEEKNTGSMVDATRTEKGTEEPTLGQTEGWTKKMTKGRTEEINVGSEENAEELLYRRQLAAESGDGRTYYPFGSEIKTATRDRKSLRCNRDNSDSFSDGRLLSARWSRAADMNLIKPMKENNNTMLAEELFTLRNDFDAMKRKINAIENSFSTMELAQNIKHNQLMGIVLKSSVNENSNLDNMNEKINNLSKEFERTVNTLLSEKESLIKVNRNIVREMKNLKTKLASVERKHNGHKNCVKKSDFDLLLVETNNLKNQTNNSKKDLDDVKGVLNGIEKSSSTRKYVDTEKIENTRKYDKLKMRLSMVENVVSACTGERSNEKPITNNHYYGPQKCTHYATPPIAAIAPPVAYSVPPPPPEPRPASSVPTSKPSVSKVAEPSKPGQYLGPPKYTITADLLMDMTKKLRTPDKDNIRKIPRRADILIPSTVTKTADQNVPLPPSPSALNDIAPEPLTS